MRVRELDTRRFKRILINKGFVYIRTSGSHEIWSDNKGDSFAIPVGRKTVKAGIVWNFLRKYK